ncbi:RNA polymerase sigma factor [Pedobacter xixiisoli]|uniref:RNA polymerase sigma factor, sigma-70 family n=1 Tax=Pedobacter xixiisoli TaxID=1476464 RepID=A0A285ZUN6_9SPHI|nr:sigma-70 family RNA polymerase sigma factor [Pedobacter xixiisoli]SOD13365.1 RNA polymerase sigma factor, sigma-70 family [Pedobacter xixiisoli]
MTFDKRKQDQQDDELLWSGLRNGDASSFDALIKKYTDILFNYGSRFNTDRDIVKDCIQELFVELWKKREGLTLPKTIKWYLFVALRNRIFREQTKWNKTETLTENDHDFFLEYSIEEKIIENTEDAELANKIKKILNSLPARQREIIYLRYYENYDYDQISELMNINKQSVHNLLQKAYKSIRSDWPTLLFLISLLVHQQKQITILQ